MTKYSFNRHILITGTSFIGGLAMGMLIAPKNIAQNKQWIHKRAAELYNWLEEQGKEAFLKRQGKFSHFCNNIHQKITHHVPDLYEATARIEWDEYEF